MWWRDNICTYPNLARMALNYLSIPGMYFSIASLDHLAQLIFSMTATSTVVEWGFSQGRRFVDKHVLYLPSEIEVKTTVDIAPTVYLGTAYIDG
jgi:hAT family C-terminal dimerisation region